MSKPELSRDEINKIAAFLGQFVDESIERKEAYIKKLKEIYGENEEPSTMNPKNFLENDLFNEDFYNYQLVCFDKEEDS
jgi:hypothetical protein